MLALGKLRRTGAAGFAFFPELCESQYVQTVDSICAQSGGEVDGYFPWSDRELCMQTVDSLQTRMQNVAANRSVSTDWLSDFSVGRGAFEVSLNTLSRLGGLVVGGDHYNAALALSRAQVNCEAFVAAYDANGCARG